MAQKLLSADDFRAAAKAGQRPDGTVFRLASGEPQMVGDAAARTERFVFSDGSIDLAGDMISPKGWELDNFQRNPVALFSHMSWDPPIGRASNVSVKGDKLIGDIEFASAEVYPFADTIYRLVKGGFLKAVSVGFKPTEWSFADDKERGFGINFTKQALLEISVCCVPCNPNALNEARSAGVDTRPLEEWAEKVLDSNGFVSMQRTEIETLRKAAKDHAAPRYYVTSSRSLSVPAAKRMKEDFDRWLNDGGMLILEEGFELKTLGKDAAAAVPSETCGRAKEEECGMEDPAQCMIHAPETKSIKAGRRISAASKALLEQAIEHHALATKCIKDVIDSGPPDDADGDASSEPDLNDPNEGLEPAKARALEARKIADDLASHLKQ